MRNRYVGYGIEDFFLESMSPRQRILYYLYYEEGWSQEEIGDILRCSQTTISHEITTIKLTSASLLINYEYTLA